MSSTTYSVHVSGISSDTTQTHLHDFFTFCGKIESIDFKGSDAAINFEKPSAAKTALMLNGGTLDGAILSVTSEVAHSDDDDGKDEPFTQSDKPRAGIAAEYLAKGYTLSDHILQRAIEIDNKQGISKKFLTYIQSLDSSLGARALGPDQTISGKVHDTVLAATQQARTVDEQRGITKTATDYYSKALQSPFGKKVFDFYTSTSKQVLDIHEEAKRIHATHKSSQPEQASASAGSTIETSAEPPTSTT